VIENNEQVSKVNESKEGKGAAESYRGGFMGSNPQMNDLLL